MKLIDAFKTYTATVDSEPELANYYVETKSIKDIKSSKDICIVSGLKGVGKTATFRELAEFDKSVDLVIAISSDSYSLSLSNSDLRAITYSHEFEYEIAIEFLQRITETNEFEHRIGSSLFKSAKKFVKSFKDDLKNLGGRITGISVLGCGLDLADPEKKVLTGLSGRKNELQAIDVLKSICNSGLKIRLVIDDPEEVFFSDRKINAQLLGGLWLAVAKLNLLSSNFRCFLLLKTHVYDYVLYNTADLDKFPNSQTSIFWEYESLHSLIKSRIKFFLKVTDVKFEEVLWGVKLPSKELKENYKYIFNRLRNGPRELITWLYLALNHNNQNGKEYLDMEALKTTFNTLSKRSFMFFNSSHGEEFPDIGNIVQIIFDGIEEKEISKQELTTKVRDLQINNKDFQNLEKKHLWVQSLVSKKYTEILFRVGAINLIDKTEIYPFMELYNTDTFDKVSKIKLTPIFQHYLINA